jgi:hypothetical protein
MFGSGSGMKNFSDSDPDPGSGVKLPGSATLIRIVRNRLPFFSQENAQVLLKMPTGETFKLYNLPLVKVCKKALVEKGY